MSNFVTAQSSISSLESERREGPRGVLGRQELVLFVYVVAKLLFLSAQAQIRQAILDDVVCFLESHEVSFDNCLLLGEARGALVASIAVTVIILESADLVKVQGGLEVRHLIFNSGSL